MNSTLHVDRPVTSMTFPDIKPARGHRRSIPGLLMPLEKIAAESLHLVANHGATFKHDGDNYNFPRYLFSGPRGGDEPLRIGIFAGVHGDEPEGIHALIQFLTLLEKQPELAAGY